jgi:hypothetical protein
MRDRLRTSALIVAFFATAVLLFGAALYGATSAVAASLPSAEYNTGAETEAGFGAGVEAASIPDLARAASAVGPLADGADSWGERTARWPWVRWERRGRSPQMVFRQVLPDRSVRPYRRPHRDRHRRYRGRIEIETRYHFRVRRASWRRARAVLVVDALVVRRDGRRIGVIRKLPRALRRARVTVTRNGRVRSDRRLVVVGERGRGFELVALSTRSGPRRAGRPIAVAEVQLRRGRAVPVRRSLFLRDRRAGEPVPILTARAVRSPRPLRYRPGRSRYRDDGWRYEERGHRIRPSASHERLREISRSPTAARGATTSGATRPGATRPGATNRGASEE